MFRCDHHHQGAHCLNLLILHLFGINMHGTTVKIHSNKLEGARYGDILVY